ncbi:HupE/UreJ family protein [Duganella qianjiadongensis]|uniref:HupE-UreJ family metal transporter n=1 Tax=Duganella qianjiadongensis TaxID=2692176 RepID=A0ABW9VFJ1_9BURK|nr:HupE/UreJ family protein [Duganella qianjiadongensis]MYM37801.1 HupE-UreJ family metal transporter [Duganella qianjiadongensis]
MNPIRFIALAALAIASTYAQAHVQGAGWHSHGFRDGLLHPLTGLDHLLAMLAVGMWSVRQSAKAALPLGFLGLLLVGVLSGVAGLEIPGLEAGIALTVAMLGVLLAAAVRLPQWLAAAMLATFAILHGNAHGHELPAVASTLGLMLTSALLVYAGRVLGLAVSLRMLKWTGAALAASGAMLLTLA